MRPHTARRTDRGAGGSTPASPGLIAGFPRNQIVSEAVWLRAGVEDLSVVGLSVVGFSVEDVSVVGFSVEDLGAVGAGAVRLGVVDVTF